MKLGEPTKEDENGKPIRAEAKQDQDFIINGIEQEKLDRFELLGNWLMSKVSAKEQAKKVRSGGAQWRIISRMN